MPCITFSGLSSAPSIVRSHDRAGGRAVYGESEALNLRRLSRKVPGPGAELPITYFAHKTANGELTISCRNRHCPKCQGVAARKWLADRQAELLPVSYFHVVYTLPSPLRDVAYQNKRVVYDLLMKAAAETTYLDDLLGYPCRMGSMTWLR